MDTELIGFTVLGNWQVGALLAGSGRSYLEVRGRAASRGRPVAQTLRRVEVEAGATALFDLQVVNALEKRIAFVGNRGVLLGSGTGWFSLRYCSSLKVHVKLANYDSLRFW